MNLGAVFAIAVALAMDAFAVAIASGVAMRKFRLRHALTIGLAFGWFQALMPVLGWLGGITLKNVVGGIDHWVVFALLTFVGGKMIYEAFQFEAVEERSDPLDLWVLLVLSVATSLDALAAGFSFALLHMAILLPVIIIGSVTFVISAAGVWIGGRFGHFFERKIEIAGGVVLIAIGVKTLASHLGAG